MPKATPQQQARQKTGLKRKDKAGHLLDVRPDGKAIAGVLPTYLGEEHDQKLIELGKQGYGKAEMASALGITHETLLQWTKRYSGFAEAMKIAWTECQAFHEKIMRERYDVPGKYFNTKLFMFAMAQRFKDYSRPTSIAIVDDSVADRDPHELTDEELMAMAKQEMERMRDARKPSLPDPASKTARQK